MNRTTRAAHGLPPETLTRRSFISAAALAAGAAASPHAFAWPAVPCLDADPLYRISLAQWSLHRAFKRGSLDPLDFARIGKADYGIEAVEYVNQFYAGKARDQATLDRLKKTADDHGVKSLLIMCDGEGALGDADETKRKQAIENHHQWAEAARFLGCHSIRVNAQSSGPYDEQMKLAADGLRRLTEFAATLDINVIVENHGGLSSNGAWLAGVMKQVGHDRCGTLPDFGNFCLDWNRSGEPDAWYDRYKGVGELMPFARAVSAKSHEFDSDGNETKTDFDRMMRIVLDAGYRGWVGVEYEGDRLSEPDGIRATKSLLERVRDALKREPKYRTVSE